MPAGRHLTISGVHIEASKHVRYLGVEIDEHLTFNPQLASLRQKVGAKLSAVYRIHSHLTPKAKRTFYLSFLQSTLEYDLALDSQKRFSTQFISEYQRQVNSSYFITKNGGKKLHPYILT